MCRAQPPSRMSERRCSSRLMSSSRRSAASEARCALGLGLALLSAGCLNWGFLRQHGTASELPPLSVRRPIASLRLLFANPRWVVGFAVGLVGWALYVAALKLGRAASKARRRS